MNHRQQELFNIANELCAIATRLNTSFGNHINHVIDQSDSPEEYARFINDHANHTTVLTKLIYMMSVWEETC